MVPRCCFYVAATLFVASTLSARAADEIQVYNAEIAKVGQWTFQLHNNYAFIGRKEPEFPGGLVPNHALQGTGEWAYGITDWWEMGFYTPYAVDQELTPYSNAIKIRQLFVIPNAAERDFFYGVNFEFSYAMPQFLDTRWLIEVRPIIGWRKGDYEFIINPIVDFGIGQNGGADFAPGARERAVNVDIDADLGAFWRELVGWQNVIDQRLDESRLVKVQELVALGRLGSGLLRLRARSRNGGCGGRCGRTARDRRFQEITPAEALIRRVFLPASSSTSWCQGSSLACAKMRLFRLRRQGCSVQGPLRPHLGSCQWSGND
jgi:hypothetical protein